MDNLLLTELKGRRRWLQAITHLKQQYPLNPTIDDKAITDAGRKLQNFENCML